MTPWDDTPTRCLILCHHAFMTEMTDNGVVPVLTLGWRLKMALEHADVSVADMASYLEVNRDTISRWTGGRSPVKRSTLMLWSMRTGVSLEWLETGETPGTGGGDGGLEVRHVGLEPTTSWLWGFGADLHLYAAEMAA